MFLRRCHRKKNGKRHTYWSLVESVRTARGSRQRVVAYLGELSRGESNGWSGLGRRLEGKYKPDATLFDITLVDDPSEEEKIFVRLKDVGLERPRDFGDVWLAWGLWRLLGLDELFSRVMGSGREEVPWPLVAAILTIGRFCEPGSELHIEEKWYAKTALEDLLGVSVGAVHTDRLYEGLDRLLICKEKIEKHLKQRLGDLFDLNYELLLYDVTSTYFEGECLGNSLAKRGYSRDSRPDCLQVCIGLVVTPEGIPLGYEVFSGNTHDSKTVETIVESMENKYGHASRIWVMDRGMVSENNLQYLRDRNGSYIVGTPKAMLRQFEKHLAQSDWREVQAGVEVKLVAGPDGDETFILARSPDRRKKEQAMHERFIERMEKSLAKMQTAAQSGRIKTIAQAHERLGRIRQQNWRASGAFDVTISPCKNARGQDRINLTWKRNDQWQQWSTLSEGCYLLRTNLKETDPAVLWKRYIQLTEAEWAFRIAKDELRIRPIWHQKTQRVQAHILVCFLAYVLWKTLSQWMNRSGLGDAPRTLVEEFTKIKSGDIVLPARSGDGKVKREIHLRCVTRPDAAQKVLLHRLGLQLPQRIGRFEKIVKCSEDF